MKPEMIWKQFYNSSKLKNWKLKNLKKCNLWKASAQKNVYNILKMGKLPNKSNKNIKKEAMSREKINKVRDNYYKFKLIKTSVIL